MKLFHLSDLHLGKRFNERPMLEDQHYILQQILQLVDKHQPDAVLIAGDLYDKAIPPIEAVTLLDDFLYQLSLRAKPVLLISGNHDSAERVAFGSRFFTRNGIYFSPAYQGKVEAITLSDDHGPVHFYLLPFLKASHVRRYFPEETIATYTEAMTCAIRQMQPDLTQRNVLVTHQFVTGASLSDSEEIFVGGTENVDASVFDGFDYVALGHIHGPQQVTVPHIRYCGSPLKYSFSEAGHTKSVTLVEMGEKGSVRIETLPLVPKREVRTLRGAFAQLTDPAFYAQQDREAYWQITLTDEELIPNAMQSLRLIYPGLLHLQFDNRRSAVHQQVAVSSDSETKTPEEMFAQLYELQNNQPMTEEQLQYIRSLVESIREEEA